MVVYNGCALFLHREYWKWPYILYTLASSIETVIVYLSNCLSNQRAILSCPTGCFLSSKASNAACVCPKGIEMWGWIYDILCLRAFVFLAVWGGARFVIAQRDNCRWRHYLFYNSCFCARIFPSDTTTLIFFFFVKFLIISVRF